MELELDNAKLRKLVRAKCILKPSLLHILDFEPGNPATSGKIEYKALGERVQAI
jgi:hypothetical protein